MATISGVAKLGNDTAARRVVAVSVSRGSVLTGTPGVDGTYAIAGAGNGEWLVTAEGPAGYRPQTHLVAVTDAPEADTLIPKVWDVIDFDNPLRPDPSPGAGMGLSRIRGVMNGSSNQQVGFLPGPSGMALRYPNTATGTWPVGYSRGPGVHRGLSQWFNLQTNTGNRLPLFGVSGTQNTAASQTLAAYASMATGIEIYFHVGIEPRSVILDQVPMLSTWYFLLAQFTPEGMLQVYLNAELVHQSGPHAPDQRTGASASLMRAGFNHTVLHDEIYLFSQPVTHEEIRYMYRGGRPRSWDEILADRDAL